MGTQTNIIVGAATLTVDGTDVGFTQGGVNFRKQTEYLDVDADQLAGVARKEKTFERGFVTTTLAEATLTNLRKAMAEPASQEFNGSGLNVGLASPAVVEHTITVTGKSNSTTGVRTYSFWRAILISELDHLIGARDAASVLPVEFEVLKDPTKNNTFCVILES